MNTVSVSRRGPRRFLVLGAAVAALAAPALVAAADAADAEQERRIRELEERVRQDDAAREIAERERSQQEALRSQERAIRSLEETQRRIQSQSSQIASPPAGAIVQLERGAQLAQRDQAEALRRLEEAQRRLEASTREVAELSSELGRNYAYLFSTAGAQPRALLGVSVADGRGREGALVQQVSPGGAAAEAGIQVGDLIVSLAGQDLTKDSDPSRALVEKMREAQPNAKLRVEVLRDGKRMGFDVTPRPAPAAGSAFGALSAQLEDLQQRYNDNHPEVIRLRTLIDGTGRDMPIQITGGNTRYGGLEFATLSERLGSYFGVKEGVLVVRAGADAPFGLQDGDVILAIDGRAPSNAQHVGRILRSYQPGEKVKLRVQRDRKAIELDSTVPGGR